MTKTEELTKAIKDLKAEGKTYGQIQKLLNVGYSLAWGRVNPEARKESVDKCKGLLTKENKVKKYNQRLENDWKEIKLKDLK